jgi:uncharacterized membrane protein
MSTNPIPIRGPYCEHGVPVLDCYDCGGPHGGVILGLLIGVIEIAVAAIILLWWLT